MPAAWVPRGIGFGQVDAARIVGPSHRFKNYLASPDLMRRICSGAGKGLCCQEKDAPCGAESEGVSACDPVSACPCSLP
jgi:hypothetical protein